MCLLCSTADVLPCVRCFTARCEDEVKSSPIREQVGADVLNEELPLFSVPGPNVDENSGYQIEPRGKGGEGLKRLYPVVSLGSAKKPAEFVIHVPIIRKWYVETAGVMAEMPTH